jgi:hypothetical protein
MIKPVGMLEKYHRDEKLPQGYLLKNLPEFATDSYL